MNNIFNQIIKRNELLLDYYNNNNYPIENSIIKNDEYLNNLTLTYNTIVYSILEYVKNNNKIIPYEKTHEFIQDNFKFMELTHLNGFRSRFEQFNL
jgi:hypothetical protein